MILGDLQPWDEVAFKRNSRKLDLLSRGDFSPIKLELVNKYPDTPQIEVRAIPFVQRYVAELSGRYQKPLVRRFIGTGIETATWQMLQSVYDASELNRLLGECEDTLWTQNSLFLLPMPDGLGRVHFQLLLPWQVDRVIVRDPMRAVTPAAWDKVWFQVPTMVAENQVIYGRVYLSRDEAWRDVGGQRVGIYADDGSNPFGEVPLIACHRLRPDPGRYAAPINEAVLNLQIAISCQEADNELIIRHCAFPQKVLENADFNQLTETISLGPDKVHALVRTGDPNAPAPALRVVQGQVPVAELVSFSEHQIRLYCAMLGLDPSSFLRVNTAVTASARLFAAQDRKAQRDKIQPVLDQLERSILRWVGKLLALDMPAGFSLPADIAVSVQFADSDNGTDPYNDAQALGIEVSLGLTSPAEAVAKRDGIGLTEAALKVQNNLKASRALGIVKPAMEPDSSDPNEKQQAEDE